MQSRHKDTISAQDARLLSTGLKQIIKFPFLVTTKDDNCKKKGSPHYIEVWVQVNRNGIAAKSGSVRITITDDDQDGTDPSSFITFLKPECGAISGG